MFRRTSRTLTRFWLEPKILYTVAQHKQHLDESRARSKRDAAFDKMLDPIEGSPATGKSVAGIINLFVVYQFATGGTEMEQRVLARFSKDFQVGLEDWNDVLFTGQRIPWMKDPQSGSSIEVSQ